MKDDEQDEDFGKGAVHTNDDLNEPVIDPILGLKPPTPGNCCACCGFCGCASMSSWIICMTILNVLISAMWSGLLLLTFSQGAGIIAFVTIQAILRLFMNILGYFIIIVKKYEISNVSWIATFGNMTILFSVSFDLVFLIYSNWLVYLLTQHEYAEAEGGDLVVISLFLFCNAFAVIDLLILTYSTIMFNRYSIAVFGGNNNFNGMGLCLVSCNSNYCKKLVSKEEWKRSLETRPQRVSFGMGILSLGLFIWGIAQIFYEFTGTSIIKSHYEKWSVEYYIDYDSIVEPRQMQLVYMDSSSNNASEPFDDTIIYVAAEKGVYALIDRDSDQSNDEIHLILPSITGRSCTSIVVDRINDIIYATEWQNIYRCTLEGSSYETDYTSIHDYVLHADDNDISDLCSLWFNQTYYAYHGWHYTQLNKNTNNLCIAMGVACNLCNATDVDKSPEGDLQAKVICFNDMNNPSWDNSTDYIIGVRDVVGFDWDDEGVMWFTDHNVDSMGDNRPDGEFNKLSFIGEHFGFPMCHTIGEGDPYLRDVGETSFLVDKFFGGAINDNCTNAMFTPAIQPLGPHVAPDGVMYYESLSNDDEKVFLIGQHGSWNRLDYIGYRVVMVVVDRNDDNIVLKHELFVDGWLNEEKQLFSGRPVDTLELRDGSVLISDDLAGTIFRVFDDDGKGKTVEQECISGHWDKMAIYFINYERQG